MGPVRTPSRGRRLYRDAHPGSQYVADCARGACTPSRGRRLSRPRGTPGQPLSECVGPVPPLASVICTNLAGCLFQLSTYSCVSAWGLYPLPRCRLYRSAGRSPRCSISSLFARAGPVPPSAGVAHGTHCLTLFECVGPVSPFASVVCTDLGDARFSLATAVT